MSPLGFSAADILAYAAGSHDSTLAWHEFHGLISYYDHVTDLPAGTYSPGAGESAVTFTITHADGGIRFVHQEPRWPEVAQSCSDWLELDVDASLVTNDGALNESLSTTLFAHSSRQADWWAHLPLSEIKGSFRVMPNTPLFAETLEMRGHLGPVGNTGHISGTLYPPPEYGVDVLKTMRSVDIDYADWPASEPQCFGPEIPLGMAIDQFSTDDAIALINDSIAVPLQWGGHVGNNGQSSLTLRVSSAGQTACPSFSDEPRGRATLTVHAHLNATTADALMSTDLPILIRAIPDKAGALSKVTMAVDSPYDKGAPPSDLYARLGFPERDFSGYGAANCSLELTLTPAASGTHMFGQLLVYLFTGTPCVKKDIADPDCPGELSEMATWSTAP